MASAKKGHVIGDKVNPHTVGCFITVDVIAQIREVLDESFPNHEVSNIRVDVDRMYDSGPFYDVQPWSIPVTVELDEL